MAEYIELIDKYRITQSKDTDYNPPSYEWVDNTGEIVRCKDCKYAPTRTDGGGGRGFVLEWPYNEWPESNPCPCRCDDGWYSREPNPDFFCANGKREER